MSIDQSERLNPVTAFDFTSDWFSRNIPIWTPLLTNLSPSRILEIGSHEGRSTCFLIELLSTRATLEVHCVDVWGPLEAEDTDTYVRFRRNTDLAISRAKNEVLLTHYRGLSENRLLDIINSVGLGYFDFFYIDGGHESTTVLIDALLAFKLARVGALIIFDDYLWAYPEPMKVDLIGNPKLAIDSFTSIFWRKIRILHGLPLYQIFIQKLVQ